MGGAQHAVGHDNLTRPQIRKLLELALRTEAELDAFCLDHFPAIKSNFSAGMSRLQKMNLFLEQVEHNDLMQCITNNFTAVSIDSAIKADAASGRYLQAIHSDPVVTISERTAVERGWPVLRIFLLGAVGIISLGWISFYTARRSLPDSTQLLTTHALKQINQAPELSVTTQPTDALIFDSETGVLLGRSPLKMSTYDLLSGRQLCILHTDYHPEYVILQPKDIERNRLLIRLRPESNITLPRRKENYPQTDDRYLFNATKKMESCLVTTPLIK
mgnify:CR=1 FL=1